MLVEDIAERIHRDPFQVHLVVKVGAGGTA